MILLFKIIATIIFAFILVYLCIRRSLFMHYSGEVHQNFIKSKKTPLIGGIIIFFYILVTYHNFFLENLFLFIILLIGILSDIRSLKSAYLRLFFQLFVITLFIILNKMNIFNTRIYFLDYLLVNYYASIFFSTLCVLIVINGSNFIDGSNLLAIGYFIILEIIFITLGNMEINLEYVFFQNKLIYVLIIIFILNAFNKLYLGDGGSYLLGFIYSFKFISLYNLNQNISPFFIALILWYPVFEILFSILRKLKLNRSPIKPDSNHLHQLLYFYLQKKISNQILRSNIVGIIINIFNFIIILLSMINIYNTQYQIFLLLISISVYTFFYIRLLKFKLGNNF